MPGALKVVICDDDAERVEEWAARVAEQLPGADVVPLAPPAFGAGIRALKSRMQLAMAGQDDTDKARDEDQASIFDVADVLMLDSDLTPGPDSDPGDDPEGLVATHLVGELGGEVARLARTYTRCRAIVVVNQGAKVRTFDLTMMRPPQLAADVYITDDEIDDPGLWDPAEAGGYRPWHWPVLGTLPTTIEESIGALDGATPVLDALGLADPRTPAAMFSRQVELLGCETADEVRSMTLDGVASSTALGLGVRPKQTASPEERLRVAVCGLRRWLERVVVPSQNILIDLPHLLQRDPWLVSRREDLEQWNRHPGYWFPDDAGVCPAAFNEPVSRLLGRNVWNALDLPRRPSGERVLPTDPVFCEDTSTFVLLTDAVDVMTDIESPQPHRFVRRVPGVEYSPRNRLVK